MGGAMTGKTFLNRVANGETDVVGVLLAALRRAKTAYCVIGGLGVNAYAEPVVSLDLDLVVIADRLMDVRSAAESRGWTVEPFEHSVNISAPGSDLRIQLQTDPRYQDFLGRAAMRRVLGYDMSVASPEDVLRGKIWAYSDETRRQSKRQKDLSDILRMVEARPDLRRRLPPEIASLLGA